MAGQKVQAAIEGALAELNLALRLRDVGFVDGFHKTAILVGSEASDLSRGRDAIREHFTSIFTLPATLQFTWRSVGVTRSGDTAWFFAEGELVVSSRDGETRRPYGLTGVLDKSKRGWRWRLFHGAEPATIQQP